jgi:pentatricopeptide repeat protein
MSRLSLFLFLLFIVPSTYAQAGRDEALANSYFQEGEYEKAVELFQSLWEKNENAPRFYAPLFKCYVNLKQYEALEKVVRKQQKKFPTTAQYAVDLGYVLNTSGQAAKGKEQFDKLIKSLPQNEAFIKELGGAFETYKEFEYAIQVYEKGGKLFNNSVPFGFLLANAYAMQGDYDNAAKQYINFYELQPAQSQNVKNQLMRSSSEKLLGAVEAQLYAKLQRNSGDEYLSDLLIWIYIQNKDFDGAMQQTKAIDRRKSENGFRVLNLARMAAAEDMFDVAINGYEYVILKGKESPLYLMARTELLNCRKEKIASKVNFAREDLLALRSDYESFIKEMGKGNQTAQSMKELAELNGFYLQDIPTAIALCEEILKMPGISREVKKQNKIIARRFSFN